MARMILVYRGARVGARAFRHAVTSLREEVDYPIKAVDRHFFLQPNWEEKTALVVIPGGRDLPYHTALQGEANARILRFVEEGGSYLGLCAGGYYGASEVEFEKGGELEVSGSRELAFFPGKAVGPAYEKGVFRYESELGARAAAIEWCQGHSSCYFNGGCLFERAENYPNITVLARYHDLPKTPAAIIYCQVNRGRAILSGVHPEYPNQQGKPLWRYLLSLIINFNL